MSKRGGRASNALEGPVTRYPPSFPERHILVKCPGCKRVIDQAKLPRTSTSARAADATCESPGARRMRITV